MDVLQKELDEIRKMWNTHSIVKSRTGCHVYGVPDELFYIPEIHGKNNLHTELCNIDMLAL